MTLSPAKQGLKVATTALFAAVGGQEPAAMSCRVGQSKLSDYGNVFKPEAFAPIDVVIDLEAITRGLPGAPHVTRYLALRAGFALVPLPQARPTVVTFEVHLAACAKETADVITALATSLNGGVCQREAKAVRAEIAHAVQVLMDLDAALAEREADTS